MTRPVPVQDRLWSRVEARDPFACWPYTGPVNEHGYGRLGTGGRGAPKEYAHRLAFVEAYGPFPPELKVCHDCDNPPCVNPLHLFLGTQADNLSDMRRKGRQVVATWTRDRHPQTKLSYADIEVIRSDPRTGAEMARRFGVGQSQISRIRRGQYK